MEKISDFISKKVISIEEACNVGYILNVIFDSQVKLWTGLSVIDEESENSFMLSKQDIESVGEDCIMIKTSKVLQFDISSNTNNPVGKLVYDLQGNNLGRVLDVEISGKLVKKIITNKCEFPAKYIRKSGDNYIIFGSQIKASKKKNFKEIVGENNADNLPKITISEKPQTTQGSNIINAEFPIRLYADTKTLIGKVITCDILGYNNEIIAHKNQKINQTIINKAISHNKINLLNFFSK